MVGRSHEHLVAAVGGLGTQSEPRHLAGENRSCRYSEVDEGTRVLAGDRTLLTAWFTVPSSASQPRQQEIGAQILEHTWSSGIPEGLFAWPIAGTPAS